MKKIRKRVDMHGTMNLYMVINDDRFSGQQGKGQEQRSGHRGDYVTFMYYNVSLQVLGII